MPNRKTSESSTSVKVITSLAFIGFVISGLFYIFAPTQSSSQYYDSSIPAVLWGVVFVLGGFFAIWGIMRKTPHLERLGLMLVVIAGTVLTISQAAVMFEVPITWTRGGGTGAYGSFTLLALALWLRLGRRVEAVNFVADMDRGEGDGP